MRNIIWICNKIPTSIAELMNIKSTPLGGWLDSMAMSLIKNELQLTLVCKHHRKIEKKINSTSLYTFTDKDSEKSIKKTIKKAFEKEKPDVIHIWGTEYKHSFFALKVAEDLGINKKCVVSIQGLVSIIGQYHFDVGIPLNVKYGFSIRDLIKHSNVSLEKRDFKKRGEYEIKTLRKVKHIIGRTEWDYALVGMINCEAKYYCCNETLRDIFYGKKWEINNINRHSIFVSQCNYPLKGFHYMLQAMTYVLKEYPDAILYATGYDLFSASIHDRIRLTYYQLYLRRLIKKYKLKNNIVFLGVLDEEKMKEQYLKSNVFVSPSTIENSSNSLGEAMLLGCPIVASDVGGTKSMIRDKIEGFLYPINEPYMLAYYVCKIFEDDDLANGISYEARKRANSTHERSRNFAKLLNIYNCIYKNDR